MQPCNALTALILAFSFAAGASPRAATAQVLGTPVHRQGSDNDSLAVVRAVDAYHQALSSADSVTVLDLLAPDATILESGAIESREEYLSHHLAADIAFARAVARERGPIRVGVRGDAAWATSASTSRGEYRGRAIDSVGAELMVLSRTSEGWKISAIHWSSRSRSP